MRMWRLETTKNENQRDGKRDGNTMDSVRTGVNFDMTAPGGFPQSKGVQPPVSAGPADPLLIADLVIANRILSREGIVDGFGHVSVRHNANPERFLLAASMAPELVTAEDILEYDLEANPIKLAGARQYLERFIHSEIYKVRPDVQAIVHNHSPAVIPFGVSAVPLRPIYHMAAFIGSGIPNLFKIKISSSFF